MKRSIAAAGIWMVAQAAALAATGDLPNGTLPANAPFLAVTQPLANGENLADGMVAPDKQMQNLLLYGVGAFAVLLALKRRSSRR